MAPNLPFGSGVLGQQSLHKLTRPTSAPFRVRATRPYPVSYPEGLMEDQPNLPVSCCLSATGVRFLGHPVPAGDLSVPHSQPTGRQKKTPTRTPTGFPRFTRVRYDRGGCPLNPEAAVSTWPAGPLPASACRFPAASPAPHYNIPSVRLGITRHHQGFTHVHPSGLPRACGSRMEREPLGHHT
jgi:hypothetical protein